MGDVRLGPLLLVDVLPEATHTGSSGGAWFQRLLTARTPTIHSDLSGACYSVGLKAISVPSPNTCLRVTVRSIPWTNHRWRDNCPWVTDEPRSTLTLALRSKQTDAL